MANSQEGHAWDVTGILKDDLKISPCATVLPLFPLVLCWVKIRHYQQGDITFVVNSKISNGWSKIKNERAKLEYCRAIASCAGVPSVFTMFLRVFLIDQTENFCLFQFYPCFPSCAEYFFCISVRVVQTHLDLILQRETCKNQKTRADQSVTSLSLVQQGRSPHLSHTGHPNTASRVETWHFVLFSVCFGMPSTSSTELSRCKLEIFHSPDALVCRSSTCPIPALPIPHYRCEEMTFCDFSVGRLLPESSRPQKAYNALVHHKSQPASRLIAYQLHSSRAGL